MAGQSKYNKSFKFANNGGFHLEIKVLEKNFY
jgi:hypothetical protein